MSSTQSHQGSANNASGGERQSSTFDCNICFEPVSDPVVTRCGHLFCWKCLSTWLDRGNSSCPVCQGYINRDQDVIPLYGKDNQSGTLLLPLILVVLFLLHCITLVLFCKRYFRARQNRPEPRQRRTSRPPFSGQNPFFDSGFSASFLAFPFSFLLPVNFNISDFLGFSNLNRIFSPPGSSADVQRAHLMSIVMIAVGLSFIAYTLFYM